MVRLEEHTRIQAPIERCFDLARSVEVHLAGNIHWGESAVAAAGITTGLLSLGQRVTWRAKHFGLWHTLTSEITAMEFPVFFQDTMIRGPFRSMKHDHRFQSISEHETNMADIFWFAAPTPLLGRNVEATFLRRYMQNLLRERNAFIQQIAEFSDWRLCF